jgi:hypothetical protein
MENNDSPYVYEKPLRANGARFTKAVTAVGLVAFGTVIGGGAFANSIVAEAETQPQKPVVAAVNDAAQEVASGAPTVLGASQADVNSAIVAVPLEQSAPNKNSAAIELPVLANQSYGNTSSATPSAGGSQSGANSSGYSAYEDDEDDEDSDDHDDDDRDHDDDDEEYED